MFNTRTRLARIALTLGLLALGMTHLAPPAAAQTVPKLTNVYKDEVDLGFVFQKMPSWGFVPAQPDETNLIGKYTQGYENTIRNPKTGMPLEEARVELLKFDRRKKEEPKPGEDEGGDEKKKKIVINLDFGGLATFEDYAKRHLGDWKQIERKEVKKDGVLGTRLLYSRIDGAKDDGIELAALAYVYKLSADIDIAVISYSPGGKKAWGKWEGALDDVGKSFKRLELNTKLTSTGPRGNSPRDLKRWDLEQQVMKNPGWALYESHNYFIITSKNDDKQFIKELIERLEAIREVYETLYSIELVKELRLLAKARRNAEEKEKPDAEKKPDEIDIERELAGRTVAANIDPMELSRCSVVRVCKDDDEYTSYGGPGGSAGYWSSWHQELVIYDDQKGGGRRNTWATLNHEAFHQYIFYFLGNFAPHSWYNEGNGDFFSGYQLNGSKFKLRPFDWRIGTIKEQIKLAEADRAKGLEPQRGVVPLKEIVRWTQQQYYSNNAKYETDGGIHYAQGWSFVYFLRTGKDAAKYWNPAYEKVLDVYLRTLVETDSLDQAVDAAFAGIDFDQLEKAWRDYILSL
jgi:hypothetical protein